MYYNDIKRCKRYHELQIFKKKLEKDSEEMYKSLAKVAVFQFLVGLFLLVVTDKNDSTELTNNDDLKLNAYKLNKKYNNINECGICLNKFNILKYQILLKCGHRYCMECINEWESYQSYNNYKCPKCSMKYSLHTKWKYEYQ